jgi:cag pathogenicity island protein 24
VKYRRLHPEELANLETEFINFLATNSITAEDWTRLKQMSPEQAAQLLDLFSDMVWEKVLTNVSFLQMRTSNELRIIHFGPEKIAMVVIQIASEAFNFTNPDHITSIAEGTADLMNYDPEIYKGKRDYGADKKMEVFIMMEQGAKPCKEDLWYSVQKMLPPDEQVN